MSTAFSPFRLRERASIATFVLAATFVLVLGAFFRAQVLAHEDFRRQSENNRLRRLVLTAPRGVVLDRHGKPIAENAPGFTVKLIASSVDSLRAILRRMQTMSPVDEDLEEQVVRRFRAAPYQPALVFASAG
jgi:penicillin-binding protein 2